ncbi:MAG: PIG-L family deacetylase [Acidobacteriia bacterium]|nr:PIG-L family deacetylase [Terriglobia bacterium]
MFEERIAIVAAHPDDETIGLGGQLASMRGVFVIHATDGAPRRRPDWKIYKQQRREELLRAMALAGIPEDRCLEIGMPDQQAAHHLVELTCHLSRIFDELKPSKIFTHPYEGGHPDHDATCFAVHHAATAAIWEFSSYHRNLLTGEIETACFLSPITPARIVDLTTDQLARKQQMLACFATQQETLHWFHPERECLRRAPDYDFTQPPHHPPLFYDAYNWGLTNQEWLRLARQAESRIGKCLSL